MPRNERVCRGVAVGLALALGAAASGAVGETIHIGNTGEPETLDPHRAAEVWEERIIGDLFLGLTADAADGSVVPGVARSWEVSEDGLVYTFTLGDHVWSDGEPVSAHDFVFSLRRLLDPETDARYASILYTIRNAQALNEGAIEGMERLGVRALDDDTLEITLEAPTPYFADQLSHHTALPVPQHEVEALGEDWAKPGELVSNGAYVAAEWRADTHIRLVRNPAFGGAADVAIDEVVYYPAADPAAGLRRYEAGEFDVYTDLPSGEIERLRATIPDEVHITPALGVYYYAFNTRTAPFESEPVRRALAMAIDRGAITDEVLGSGEVPAYSFVPPGTGHHGRPAVAAWKDLPYSERLVRAQDLLAQAGYGPADPLAVTLRYNTSENHEKVALAVAAMWKQIGVRTRLVDSEIRAHYEAIQEGDFEVARAGWIADYNDPENFLFLLESSTGRLNYAGYSNPEFDRLMQEAALTRDPDARAELLRAAEAIAMEEQPYTPIYHYVSKNLVKPHVRGWVDNVEDVHPTRYLSLDR